MLQAYSFAEVYIYSGCIILLPCPILTNRKLIMCHIFICVNCGLEVSTMMTVSRRGQRKSKAVGKTYVSIYMQYIG